MLDYIRHNCKDRFTVRRLQDG